jgi:hypothetical protein
MYRGMAVEAPIQSLRHATVWAAVKLALQMIGYLLLTELVAFVLEPGLRSPGFTGKRTRPDVNVDWP